MILKWFAIIVAALTINTAIYGIHPNALSLFSTAQTILLIAYFNYIRKLK